jgi:predicted transcriptional regulator
MATEQERPTTKTEFIRQLTEAGFSDFIVIDKDTAESVLTDRRLELLETVHSGRIDSVTDLSETLDRDPAAVSRDLDVLFEHDLITYEQDGSRKIPIPKHESVLVEPIL